MAAKNSVQVLVGGKVIRLTGYESEEYLEKVASYLNHKLGELSQLSSWRRMTADTRSTLLSLNVADDCFKAKQKAEELEEELQNKDRELYDLKQDIVDLKVELDELRKNANRGSQNGHGQYDRNNRRR
ncbi:MAG: cell division protein ZapA [Lachnospiraceae bacterium]|nr:cell division protein ZapA [Lachnospiraceae bacterium]